MRQFLLPAAAVLLIGCQSGEQQTSIGNNTTASTEQAVFSDVDQAVAVMQPTAGNQLSGVVQFRSKDDGSLSIVADIQGLEPNGTYGFHIHEFGDARADDAVSAGGHYDPTDSQHGLPDQEQRHAGDLGNIEADAKGNAHYEIEVSNASLHGAHPVLGRAVILHAKPDDGGQPTGNAGKRLGIGIIGIANPEAGD